MKISEAAQEQLERLWIAVEEHEALERVDPDAIFELESMQLVETRQGNPALTENGRHEAAQAIRRHRLAERLFADLLATEETLVDEHACQMEHALFDGVDEAICTLLGHPRYCPHGKPIPAGECCQEMRASVGRLIVPVCELKPGQGGQIAYIQMNDAQHLQKLMAMGVMPGVQLKLLVNSPSYVFEAGYSQFAVDLDIASDIYVRINP